MQDCEADRETLAEVVERLLPDGRRSSEWDSLTAAGTPVKWAVSASDERAARLLHIELVTRVTTQPLGYSDGVVRDALSSIHQVFVRAREITASHPGAYLFELVVWHVLNGRVRSFLSRWRAKTDAGNLEALDAGDEFRSDLAGLRSVLSELDTVLCAMDGGKSHPHPVEPVGLSDLAAELERSVAWRPMGDPDGASGTCGTPNAEALRIRKRRETYHVRPDRPWAAGLALSGGGVRSATFALGVMASLAKRGMLQQFDYLSTVSGGGYAGGFLVQLLGTGGPVSLKPEDAPFARLEGEGKLLKRLRQNARFLSATPMERLAAATAQALGFCCNLLALLVLTGSFALLDVTARHYLGGPGVLAAITGLSVLLASAVAWRGWRSSDGRRTTMVATVFLGAPVAALIVALLMSCVQWLWWRCLEAAGAMLDPGELPAWSVLVSSAAAIVSGGAVLLAFRRAAPWTVGVATVAFLVLLEATLVLVFAEVGMLHSWLIVSGGVAIVAVAARIVDVNSISLHAFYRDRIAAAFLMDSTGAASVPIRLSELDSRLVPYPIINCALNLPGSTSPELRGRLSDVFSFTPDETGASAHERASTAKWEENNPRLDLSTMIALSGAAVSPQMGLRTTRHGSFWLTLLNLRLGGWLRRPGMSGTRGPRLPQLLSEFLATDAGTGSFVHVSDGGHIENLGIYELLRRRCRYIVAVDGESDPAMTFHGLTNLQRLAYIDFGITIDAELDDLRLGEKGFSRSHFRICRIRYPVPGGVEIGYLVYLKLSLTGNEGEFIRRFRLDEPHFPHHPTSDQFFTESQFEAYRALGDHVGEKLFLPAIVGKDGGRGLELEDWMGRLGRSLLEPLRD